MNNNDYKVIHETALKTLIDVWDGIQAIKSNNAGNNNFSLKTFLADRKNNYKPTSFSSIARASSTITKHMRFNESNNPSTLANLSTSTL